MNVEKRLVEEDKFEIMRLTSELDDKKKQIYMLETQVDLLQSDKSKLERELVRTISNKNLLI